MYWIVVIVDGIQIGLEVGSVNEITDVKENMIFSISIYE